MIFTVGFGGHLKDGALDELERRLRKVVSRQEWEIRWIEYEEFPLMRQDGNGYSFHDGPVHGYSIEFHLDCEPVRFYMEPNGSLQSFVRIRHCPVNTHVAIVDMLRDVQDLFDDFAVEDDGHYWETGSTAFLDRQKAFEDMGMRQPGEDQGEDDEFVGVFDPDETPRTGYGVEFEDPSAWDDFDEGEWDQCNDDDDELPF